MLAQQRAAHPYTMRYNLYPDNNKRPWECRDSMGAGGSSALDSPAGVIPRGIGGESGDSARTDASVRCRHRAVLGGSLRKVFIRLDDICPQMDWAKMTAVESVLDRRRVHPILAVIPDCRDAKISMGPPRSDFWAWLRRKQSEGWCIALHGLEHLYVNRNAGILPFHAKSEFAGLPFAEQKEKITRGVDILQQEGIAPTLWVAPSHSFDYETVRALLDASDIRVVSDGIALLPYSEAGVVWLPQQRFGFSKVGYGVETVCLHTNWMSAADVAKMDVFIGDNPAFFDGTISDVVAAYSKRKRSKLDDLYRAAFFAERQARGVLRKWIRRPNGA
jgi:predicted deacetylase